ncbi:UDP-N-acetylmuramoylalanine--D-glutamate ligase [Algoriphagus boseongensis]|uniref:UDP-N-acetylmuramoylalanine--D-glutamate ligase n=1 Tax=Algoriphagus boseongensis TaxID=1442587 RepID=A0A4R6T235_9BACT|nr:UDP-N-acetylmuramoyl-L-alanine--D-glutamate ligase [Algoriphagus boseongensis]TDQ14641.1 UDP-N-acetylmuramoylalanine--D-glutamate ligase [Algoriphagus boseongensis]
MKQIAILGAGESGLGAAMLAKREGYGVWVSDLGQIAQERKNALLEAGIGFEEGKHDEKKILSSDLIIKSPGIPHKAPLVKKAMEEGIPVIDELEFACRFSAGKVIAITGTNGKTTTTLLTYHLLKEAGLDVGLAGNVGKSWAGQLVEKDHDWWVIETSSFQIDGMECFRPHIGMLTNITPDHLDRYEYQIEKYILSKMSLFKMMTSRDKAIFYVEDALSKKGLEMKPNKASHYGISLEKEQKLGGFFDGKNLNIHIKEKQAKVSLEDLSIKGKHNILNALFAGTAALLAGLTEEQLKLGFQTFKNAPHRMELIRTVDGVQFVNDSKGTNVESTYYALGSYERPMIWIAGGVDKGNDYSVLTSLVEGGKAKALICLGKENEKLRTAFSGIIPEIRETQDIREAVQWGQEMAEKGEVVLLSPACASFDLFKNYEDRGEQFRAAVMNLKEKQQA